MSAVTMCERLDIKSCKDTEKLKKAKDEVYLKGFYEGVMLVGECTGMKVCDAKPIIRKVLLDKGDALVYFEPESLVMSRTGDEVRQVEVVPVFPSPTPPFTTQESSFTLIKINATPPLIFLLDPILSNPVCGSAHRPVVPFLWGPGVGGQSVETHPQRAI